MTKEFKQITNEEEFLIRYIREKDKELSEKSVDFEWLRISEEIDFRKKKESYKNHRRLFIRITSVAAVLIAIITTGYFFLNPVIKSNGSQGYESIADAFQQENGSTEITLIVDGKKVTTRNKKADITYSTNGDVSIDNEKVNSSNSSGKKKSLAEDFNCVIVPKGKQTYLTLSDGTKLHVNSRSKIVYPKVFAKNKREIYIEGEAFLEVTHNVKQPFFVKTINFDIKVLGTTFNVSSYKELRKSTITLVEGSVNVSDRQNHSAKLKPSECINISDGKLGKPEFADVSQHTDWVYGYYLFNSTPLSEILTKLSFYYDVNFETEENIKNLSLSGKLDIRTDFDDVIQNLSKTAGISFKQQQGKVFVSKTKSELE